MNSSARTPEPGSLLAATLRQDYFTGVEQIVRAIHAAEDQAAAVELLREATARMGAEVAVFASFICEAESCRSYRLLLACDPDWFKEYERQGRYDNDPWLAYAQRHSVPVRSSQLPIKGESERAAVELAARYGFRSAVIVPTPSAGGLSRTGVLCLGSSKAGYFEDEGFVALRVVARSVAMEFHEWWLGRISHELIATASLSDDDLLLLAHERQGRSTKEIARSTNWSVSSVDSRFRRMIARLGVPSRKAAAQLAAEYGLI